MNTITKSTINTLASHSKVIEWILERSVVELEIRSVTFRRIDRKWQCSLNVGRGVEPPIEGTTFITALVGALYKIANEDAGLGL